MQNKSSVLRIAATQSRGRLSITLRPTGVRAIALPLALTPCLAFRNPALGVLFAKASEIAEAERRAAEERRRGVEAARARFAAD
jgi:hypothetical protein